MTKLLTLILLSALSLTGCGDLLGSKVIKKELETTQFRANCDLDVNAFSYILYDNIESQIDCLGQNLNLFIRVVKNDTKPGYMERRAFEAYLTKYERDINPDVVKALKAVYDINYLLTGDDPNYISKENVDKIIAFAKVFNQEARKNFSSYFQNSRPITYAEHKNNKARVRDAAVRIMDSLQSIFRSSTGTQREVDIESILKSFTTDSTVEYIEKIKNVLFVKKILVGGTKENLSDKEIDRLILNFPHFAMIILDIVQYKHILLNQSDIVSLLNADVDSLGKIVFHDSMGNREREHFFSYDEAVDVVKLFISSEDFDVAKYEVLIKEAKTIVMGGTPTEVTGLDFKNLITHVSRLLQRGESFHRFYKHFRVPLDSKLPVDISFAQHASTFPGQEQQENLKHFIRITKNYRFFKGQFETAYYTREYWRDADGVFEVSLLEYLVDLVFKKYGDVVPAGSSQSFSHGMSQAQVNFLINKLKEPLIEMGLFLPRRADSISDTIALLGTLFQYQSDKNGVLDVNEATEFGVSLMTSMSLASQMIDKYNKQCDGKIDQFGRVEAGCFRENFLMNLCTDYRPYFPLLFDSLKVTKCEDLAGTTVDQNYIRGYLDVSIKAARTCMTYEDEGSKEEIPYSEGDIFTILVAMMHIEATVLRWDDLKGNKNNIMDAAEVNAAYEIYSPALDGFLEKMPYVKPFKKQIYQYLIKYEEIPSVESFGSVWKFLRFMVSFNYKSPATRKTIASILYNIGEQNKKLRADDGKPKFLCTWLRDPNNIPVDDRMPAPTTSSAPGMSTMDHESAAALMSMVKVTPMASGEDRIEIVGSGCVDVEGQRQCLTDKDTLVAEPQHRGLCFTVPLFNKRFCL